jgi:hypothetical protein
MLSDTVPPADAGGQAAKRVRTTIFVEPRVPEALELWAVLDERSVSQLAALLIEEALGFPKVGERR